MTLKYGETPWDDMSREELLIEVWRMAIALNSARSSLKIVMHSDERRDSSIMGYWGKEGVGGAAIERATQALHRLDELEEEEFYRAFSRNAEDLLFERKGFKLIAFGWVVCDQCGIMIGKGDEAHEWVGQPCQGKTGCNGVYRELRWSDVRA
jgi:hypothetical protein